MIASNASRTQGFWFGTERRMQWFPTPQSGADVSPSGWGDDGSTLNGLGFVNSSFGSHKQYVFEWAPSSSREHAQLMKSYSDGTYGRGLLYFQDCLMFDTNVLPARVADPSISIGYDGGSLVYGVQPSGVPQLSGPNELPVTGARYNTTTVQPGFRKGAGGVFVPIPEGYTLALGAIHSYSGTGGVFITRQDSLGNLGATSRLTAVSDNATVIAPDLFSGVSGVWVWVGSEATGEGSVTVKAMVGRLAKTEDATGIEQISRGPWIGGQGNSGCRFVGKPTYTLMGPHNGGQIAFAATFREVGSQVNG